MNLAHLLARSARYHGARPAVSCGASIVNDYAALARRAASLGAGLRESYDLAPGDRVAVLSENRPEYLEALFGLWWAGLVAVPVNSRLHPREVGWILGHSEAKAGLASPALARGLEAQCDLLLLGSDAYEALARRSGDIPTEPAERAPDDLAWLFYTSGTTGNPKGAMLTHRNLLAMITAHLAEIDAVTPNDSIVHSAPLSHGSGMYALVHVAAAANNVVPESGRFDVDETIELIGRYPGCSFFFAPTMLRRLVADRASGDSAFENLKLVVYGGGPAYTEDLLHALDVLGPKLAQIYGQGESPMTITGLPSAFHGTDEVLLPHLRSAGFARLGVEVRVVDGDDRALPPNEVGEVVCRGDVVMAGYWRDEAATAEAMRGGWLHTGDLGAFDDSGFLTLHDRVKDMIISGGSNIYSREVEEVLLRHPGVGAVAVVGRPHPDLVEEVVAFVVPRDGAPAPGPDELDRICLEHLARYKRPRHYEVVPSLPENPYGKVLKRELRSTAPAGNAP